MVKRKKKLPRKKGLTDELSERDDDFDPEQPDKLDGEGQDEEMEGEQKDEDTFYDEEMEEESAEEKEVERQFDFVAEIAMLVDYNVIRIYVAIINHPEMSQNADLIIMITHFLKRIVNQLKQVWIFFQFDFLAAFQIFL